MRTGITIASACALAAVGSIASANISWISGESRVWSFGGHTQSGGWLEVLSASDQSYPWEPYWYARGDFASSFQGQWTPTTSFTSYVAAGEAVLRGLPTDAGARLTLDFTFDAPGFVSISTSGNRAFAGIDGFGSVTGDNTLSGWLGAGTYHLYAEAVGGSLVAPPSIAASFSITIPSSGSLPLMLVGGSMCFSRRHRGP